MKRVLRITIGYQSFMLFVTPACSSSLSSPLGRELVAERESKTGRQELQDTQEYA